MARILLVDDDVDLAITLQVLLVKEGHSVEMVHTGEEGWERARSNAHELLIFDWDLPDLNGINILKRFRDGGGTAPVLMLTGRSSQSDKELGLDTGADDYLTKPFGSAELSARIRALLRRSKAQAPVHKPLGSGNEEILDREKLSGTALAAKYEFTEVLGEGGSGIVFKARHPVMEKPVAIKMLRAEQATQESIERFEREAKAVSRLEHPNIISIFDFGLTENKQPYMVTEFIEGLNLAELLEQDGALPADFAIDLMMQVASAMSHAHQLEILHRDLKPRNIMLRCFSDRPPIPKLLDFGLAKLRDLNRKDAVELTQVGQVYGSPPYMSPEQINGTDLDERSDIYSLGCVLYATLTGVPPHLGDNAMQIMMKHLQDEVVPLSQRRPDLKLPASLNEVVSKALRKEPSKRHQSMQELLHELGTVRADLHPDSN
jgi:serine/threonine protein kinase/CheY-like chemotaxis protein